VHQVRGKKNLVISKALTGPINLFVNFPTLKDYGVDKLFVLENDNTDSSQRSIVYLVHGEKASQVQGTAGMKYSLNETHFPCIINTLSVLYLVYPYNTHPNRGILVTPVFMRHFLSLLYCWR
jgi:hypothetical protein